MKKLNVELKSVSVDLVCKVFGLEKECFNKGSGVYCISFGSRNVVEEVEFSNEYMEVSDLVEDDGDEEGLDYYDEFYIESGIEVVDGIEKFLVCYDEENGVEFVNVVV